MTTFINNDVASGDVVRASDHNTQGALLAAVLNGGITNDNVSASAGIESTKLSYATGFPVQMVATNYNALKTGTTIMPVDDTIPQNTEGNEFMSQTITPRSAANRLFIEAKLFVSHSGGVSDIAGALFKDSDVDAIAASSTVQAGTTYKNILYISHDMVAGTTSPITFKIRAGSNAAGTLNFNGNGGGARLFGGVTGSTIKITEYKA